jgi:hypothetical protein
MTVEMIEAKDVPQVAKEGTSRAKASRALVQSLKPGKAARVEPNEGEALRGLKVSITRAAKALSIPVSVVSHDGVLYVQLSEDRK